jgi:hypothetical protein
VENDIQAFIVRIWHEEEDDQQERLIWRGSIEEVGSDKRLYFYDLDGIIRYIQEHTGIDARRSLTRWQSFLSSIRSWISKEFS